MELGADAVLVNTAIAVASDPNRMAVAFRMAVEAGRAYFVPVFLSDIPSLFTSGRVPLDAALSANRRRQLQAQATRQRRDLETRATIEADAVVEICRRLDGNPLALDLPIGSHPDGYDVWSCGPDGVSGTDDDIGNWSTASK